MHPLIDHQVGGRYARALSSARSGHLKTQFITGLIEIDHIRVAGGIVDRGKPGKKVDGKVSEFNP